MNQLKKIALKVALTAASSFVGVVHAGPVVIGFEGYAPAGSLTNVDVATPYVEGGFTLTPTNGESAVFDSAASSDMPGNLTDWFGFADGNFPSLALTAGGSAFSLASLLIGPSTIGGGTVDFTISGLLVGGGTLVANFTGLTTATLAELNWNNLVSVSFRATDDAGIDNITLNDVPEPGTLALLSVALAGVAASRRRKC